MEPFGGRTGDRTSVTYGPDSRSHDFSIHYGENCRAGSLFEHSFSHRHLVNNMQNIVSLQRKKKHIAKFTFDAETQETQSGALEVSVTKV